MIEHLKNIGVGLCCIGVALSIVTIIKLLCVLAIDYPSVVINIAPILVIIVAWVLGNSLRN